MATCVLGRLHAQAGASPSSVNQDLSSCFPSQTAVLRRQGRYICSTVPTNAQEEAQSLFVTEVMCFFYINLHVILNSFFSNDTPFFKFQHQRGNYIFMKEVKIGE